jgi:hypothetical protein
MSMFNLKEVSEEVKGGSNQTYIYPGIRNQVIISKWVTGRSAKQETPFIGVQLVTKEGKEAAVDPKQFEFYVSPAAIDTSMKKIKHIVTKVTTAKIFESKEVNSAEELVEHLNEISRGGVLRMKFTGEEYLNSNNEVKSAARIGLPEFAEAVNEGAEYEPISDENTKLTFDESNRFDFKKLPVLPTQEAELSPEPDWLKG